MNFLFAMERRVDAGSIWGDYSLAATVTFPAGNSTARLYFRVRDVASFYYLQIDSGGAWSRCSRT